MSQESPFERLVKEYRRALGLTQDELARRVGGATITIRKIESGRLRPSVQVAERLAMALKIPLEERADFVRQARATFRELSAPTPASPPLLREIGGEDLSGRFIRGYELGERIGEGGFGAVYRAIQPVVEREVAVKIILPKYANHPDFIRRFEAEARLVARLEHPHIVPLYDYWREPDAAYLVMRLLRGGNLKELLKEGTLKFDVFLQVLEQIGAALHAAHRFGIIHRDLKPANILLDQDENAYLADFGIAKNLGNPNLEDETQAGALIGSPAYISPEQIRSERIMPQADIYCLGVLVYELLTGKLPFQGPTPIHYIMQHLNQPLPPPSEQNPALPTAIDPVLQRAMDKDPAKRYPDVLNLLASIRDALGAGVTTVSGVPGIESLAEAGIDVGKIENPYKGLRAFGEADAEDFFGRETLVQELLARMAEDSDPSPLWLATLDRRSRQGLARFLAVVGPSGSGKSSVVKAGLIPALRRGGLPGSENWFVVEFMPGGHPLEELEAALLRVAVNPPTSLLEQLQENERGLLRAVWRILPDDDLTELVLVIDQFEEVFTLVEAEETRAHFLESLVTAVLDPRSRLRVVITLRADFTDRPLQYVDFGELVRERTEFVLPLTPDELEQAITGPARRVGLIPEPGLVNRIVQEVGDQPGTLPLLQYALTELFERRDGRKLTLAAYQDTGGALGALGRRAEEIYAGLDKTRQDAARQLFLRLVTLGEGVEDTRRRVLRSELESLAATSQFPLSTIITAFGRYRLLTFDRDPVTRNPTVEVAHESLLREWLRLRSWLDESRADMRMQRILGGAATEWLNAGRESSFLLRGARLTQFEEWAAWGTVALTQDEQNYLDASVAERRAREAAEAERQARETALEQRSRNFLRALVAVFALATVVALFLSGFAFNQREIARQNAAAAAQAQVQARAGELSALSLTQLDQQLDLSLLLSVEAFKFANVLQTRQSLFAVWKHNPRVRQFLWGDTSSVWSMAWSEDGRLASGSRDGDISIWTLNSEEPALILRGHTAPVLSVAWSGDGRLASGSRDGTVILWDLEVGSPTFGKPAQTLRGHTSWVWSVAWSEDGRLAAGGCGEEDSGGLCTQGEIILWDTLTLLSTSTSTLLSTSISSGEPAQILRGHQGPVLSVAWSEDGRLASGSSDNTVILWDTSTLLSTGTSSGEPAQILEGHQRAVLSVAWSGGGRLASGSDDNTIILWDLESGEPALILRGHQDPVLSVVWSGDGWLASGSCGERDVDSLCIQGEIILWGTSALLSTDVESDQPAQILQGHQGSVRSVVWFGNGRLASGGCGERDSNGNCMQGEIILWDTSALLSTGTSASSGAGKGGEPTQILQGHQGSVLSVAWSGDGRLASGSLDNTIILWDTSTLLSTGTSALLSTGTLSAEESGESVQILEGHQGAVLNVAWSGDGQLASSSGDDTIILWDLESGEPAQTLEGHQGSVLSVAWSGDGRLASGSDDNTIIVWDTSALLSTGTSTLLSTGTLSAEESGESVQILEGHQGAVRSVAWSGDGWLASGSDDNTIILWDLESGEPAQTLEGHQGAVRSVVWSEDGRLASSSKNGVIIIWDTSTLPSAEESGKPAQILRGHQGVVRSVAFSPDGKTLVSGSDDGTIWLWDVETGQPLGEPLINPNGKVMSVAFSPDGKILVFGGVNGDIVLWDVLEGWAVHNCQRAGRNLTYKEWNRYFPEEPYHKTCEQFPDHPNVIPGLIEAGESLARQGKIKEAQQKYQQALQLDPSTEISAESWNAICWFGSLWGYAADVSEACDIAVDLAPDNGGIRDSRGLARALTNNYAGAIEDFRFAVEWFKENDLYEEYGPKREAWIAALENEQNPFDGKTLETLKNE